MKKNCHFSKIALAALLGMSFCMSAVGCNSTPTETYEVVISEDITGGKITASKTKVESGEDVLLSLEVYEGMVLEYVTVNGIEVSFYDGEYTLFSVDEDCVIDAKFISSAATIRFVTGTDEEIEPKSAVLYETVGELPQPMQGGNKKFLGWYDAAEGGNLIKRSSIVSSNDFVLYAHWEILSDEYLSGLVPYSITNSVYASEFAAYGISYHTTNAAVQPQILITSLQDEDFYNAIAVDCSQEYFYEEYVSQGVIDVDALSLTRGEKYLVKVGDSATNVYSEPFTLTARKLTEGETKFVFVTDTQQDVHNEYYTSVDGITYEGGIKKNHFRTLMDTAIANNPDFDFVAHGGDFVNYGAETEYWAQMISNLGNIMFEYPMLVAPGNHEGPNFYGSGKWGLMSKMFNVNMPIFGTSTQETYVKNGMSGYAFSVDLGALHFVVLNSNDVYSTNATNAPSKESLSNAQLNWLRADLKANAENEKTKFTVAIIHEGPVLPTHSSNESNDHYKGLRGPLLKELRLGEVDLLLCGHNHYYFSSYPLGYDENASTMLQVEEKYVTVERTAYTQETLNGISYNTFTDYTSGADGTILMEGSSGGPQNSSTTFNYANMQENVAKYAFYRYLLSPGKGCVPQLENRATNMYSYIKVTDTQLTVEAYAMNFSANYGKDFANGDTPEVVLVDTLLLKK